MYYFPITVNVGGYIQAVLDRNLAENISRVLYPNDNVRKSLYYLLIHQTGTLCVAMHMQTWIRGNSGMLKVLGAVDCIAPVRAGGFISTRDFHNLDPPTAVLCLQLEPLCARSSSEAVLYS